MNKEDRYITALALTAVLVLVAGLLGIVVIALWHYLFWIALTILLIGLGGGVLELYMHWERHRIDIEARRNRALLIHESEHGFGYLHNGQVQGYTHALQQYTPPPFLPGPALGQLESVEPAMPHTFGEMVQSGHIAPGLDYVLAYDEQTGEPIKMPALTSLGVGGGQGMGKTVTDLSIMLQTIIKYNGRVRFLVADPHKYVAGDESLSSKVRELYPFFLTLEDVRTTVPPDDHEYLGQLLAFPELPNPVGDDFDLEGWMKVLELEMDRRLHGKAGEMWVLVVDEFAAIMGGELAKPFARLLEKINQQARKVGMFALLTSQEWKATRTGGSELRHSIVSFVAHNMPQAISELMLPSDVARQTPTLDVGEVLVWNKGKVSRGRVPYASTEDAAKVVELYYPRHLIRISEVTDVLGSGVRDADT